MNKTPPRPERPPLTLTTKRGRPGKPTLAEQLASVREAQTTADQDIAAYRTWLLAEEQYLLARMEEGQARQIANEARHQARQERQETETKATVMDRLLQDATGNPKMQSWLKKYLDGCFAAEDAESRRVFASFGINVPTSAVEPVVGSDGNPGGPARAQEPVHRDSASTAADPDDDSAEGT